MYLDAGEIEARISTYGFKLCINSKILAGSFMGEFIWFWSLRLPRFDYSNKSLRESYL